MDDGQLPPGTLERLERAEQLKLDGLHVEALMILEDLVLEDPSNVAALEEIADNELSLERFDRAEVAASQAVALDPSSYTGHYILGFLRSRDGKWSEALVRLKEANRLKANNPEILRCLGWALLRSDLKPQGVVTLERSLNLDNDNPLTLCDLGIAYVELRNFPKARALLLRTLDIDPENTRARECIDAIDRLEKAMSEKTQHIS
jgi:eukaryotic-like serine/threonine-protein kinase